jgi:Raf kinase inhibitor-like YbhB/YbcL family protein
MITRRSGLLLLSGALLALAACGGDDEPSGTPAANTTEQTQTPDSGVFRLESGAFEEDEPIPARHTCEGANLSPPLSWTGAPEGVESFTLILDDPDAPAGTFTHWLLFDLPAGTTFVPENVEVTEEPAVGGAQGTNDGSKVGYTGPCPPEGSAHRYVFTLYALDAALGLEPGAAKDELVDAMEDHIVAEASLAGTFER